MRRQAKDTQAKVLHANELSASEVAQLLSAVMMRWGEVEERKAEKHS